MEDRDELLRRSDFVVLMTTYNESTHKLIGEREFELMKPSAFFVNTARGRIVDEPALVAALRDGQIAGAGLDVYWNEPPISEPAPSPELFEFDNVILTPHMGSATHEARDEDGAGRGREPARDDRREAGAESRQPGGLRRGPAEQPDRLG